MSDDEARATVYRLEQAVIAIKRKRLLVILTAPAAPFFALVRRYQPIRDYQKEARRYGREQAQPKDNGVTVN